MPRRVLTETFLKGLLKKKPKVRKVYTEPGRRAFQMRHEAGGAISFWVRVLRKDGEVPVRLGVYPAMSLAEAHEAHAMARAKQDRGIDPVVRRTKPNTVTIRNVIAEWAWHRARKERKRPREAVRLLKVNLGEPWKRRPVVELTRRDGVLLLDRIVARGSLVMANRVFALGFQAFTVAVSRDLVPNNPFLGVDKPGGKEQSRERNLEREELKTAWAALDNPKNAMSSKVRLALKLILVTAQRPGEVAHARFDQFDLTERRWTIPAVIAKNGKEHDVPLTDLAVFIIKELRVLGNGSPCILPGHQSNRRPNDPITVRAFSQALRNNHKGEKLFGIESFTPHDLRRSAATMMTTLGIPRLHVAKVLNHSDEGTTAKYDRNDYWPEKQRALTVWADELQAIISGTKRKVVAIGARR